MGKYLFTDSEDSDEETPDDHDDLLDLIPVL